MKEVIKLDPNATEVLEPEAMEGADILSGTPNARFGNFFTVPVNGELGVGMWASDPYEEHFDGYPADEVMIVIEGSVTWISDAGAETRVEAGEAAFIPKGWKGRWKQTEPIRKFTIMV